MHPAPVAIIMNKKFLHLLDRFSLSRKLATRLGRISSWAKPLPTPAELRGMDFTNTLGKTECESAVCYMIALAADASNTWDEDFYISDFPDDRQGLRHGFLHLLERGYLRRSVFNAQRFELTPDLIRRLARLQDVPVERRHMV